MRAARVGCVRLLAIAAIGVALVGCRLAGSGSTSVSSLLPSASASAGEVAVDLSPSQSGPEAPEDCGFPPGAALEFAGRSTYAALGVGDAAGASVDPMSDDPADIYITRDKFDQGDLHGRLVCAIFVDTPGFVEITVHPEDGGNIAPTPVPMGERPSHGISEADAIEAARDELSEPDEWEIQHVEAGPIGRVFEHGWDSSGAEVSADHWVWGVFAVRGDQGKYFFIDYVDGTLLGSLEAIID